MTADLMSFDASMSASAARAVLEGAGWSLVGTGDWSWALASPDDHEVAMGCASSHDNPSGLVMATSMAIPYLRHALDEQVWQVLD